MKQLKIAVIVAGLCLLSVKAAAQFYPDYTQNYFTQTHYWDAYYDSIRTVRMAMGDSTMKGCGYGKYTQWRFFWDQYVGENGSLQEASQRYNDYYNQVRYDQVLEQQTSTPDNTIIVPPVSWDEIGPDTFNNIYIRGYNSNTSQTEWFNPHAEGTYDVYFFGAHVGRFDRIFRHPAQPNTFYTYAGNVDNYAAGSLFKTTDGGNNWAVVPGIDKVPFPLITGFEVKPSGANPLPQKEIMFVTLFSGAVYRSTDDGVNWTECGYHGSITFPPSFGTNYPDYSIPNFFDINNNINPLTPVENENFKLKLVYTEAAPSPYARLLVCRQGGLYYSDNYSDALTVSGNTINNSIYWNRFTSIDNLFLPSVAPYLFPAVTVKDTLAVTDVEQFTHGYTTYLVAHVSRKELDASDNVKAVRSYIIYSVNDGASWSFLGDPLALPNGFADFPGGNRIFAEANIEVRPNGANYVYISYTHPITSGYTLFRFDLNTQQWQDLSTNTGNHNGITATPNSFAINPDKEDEYWVFMNFYTHVNGNIINTVNDATDGHYGKRRHPDTRDILIVNDTTMYIATDGGIYKSYDAGITYIPMSAGLGGANTGEVCVSQQPPFYAGSGFWHSGFQIYNPDENRWHYLFDGIGDGGGGRFSFLNNQIYSAHQYDPGGKIIFMKNYNYLQNYTTDTVSFYPSWSENKRGLVYLCNTHNQLKKSGNDFVNYAVVNLPASSPGPIVKATATFTKPNDEDKLVVYDESSHKLFFLKDMMTAPVYDGAPIDLDNAYQSLSGSVHGADFYFTKTIAFDPNDPDKFWIILKSQAAWDDPEGGRIATYDSQTGFTDITYLTDDVIYGTATTVFPKHIAIRDIALDRQTGIV